MMVGNPALPVHGTKDQGNEGLLVMKIGATGYLSSVEVRASASAFVVRMELMFIAGFEAVESKSQICSISDEA